jgi:hypothetical protein
VPGDSKCQGRAITARISPHSISSPGPPPPAQIDGNTQGDRHDRGAHDRNLFRSAAEQGVEHHQGRGGDAAPRAAETAGAQDHQAAAVDAVAGRDLEGQGNAEYADGAEQGSGADRAKPPGAAQHRQTGQAIEQDQRQKQGQIASEIGQQTAELVPRHRCRSCRAVLADKPWIRRRGR